MKETILVMIRRFKNSRGMQIAVFALIAFCLVPSEARGAGISDILTLFRTITSTIQNAIGGALSGIENLYTNINSFRQQTIWPLTAINQAKGFVNSTQAQYGNLMFQIQAIRNNSATLTNPVQLESVFRNGQAGAIPQLASQYRKVYALAPPPADASPAHRNMIDMDDALALGSLKTTVLSDATSGQMLALADSLEQQSARAAPGSGPMLTTQAQVANLETQAYLAKMLAAELRQEAGRLAHQNALLKQSASATRKLQNQLQQALTHP
jgi:hypothetical protein